MSVERVLTKLLTTLLIHNDARRPSPAATFGTGAAWKSERLRAVGWLICRIDGLIILMADSHLFGYQTPFALAPVDIGFYLLVFNALVAQPRKSCAPYRATAGYQSV